MDEKQFKLELTLEEINLIAAALGKLPLEQSIQLFSKLQQEVAKQSAPESVKQKDATELDQK